MMRKNRSHRSKTLIFLTGRWTERPTEDFGHTQCDSYWDLSVSSVRAGDRTNCRSSGPWRTNSLCGAEFPFPASSQVNLLPYSCPVYCLLGHFKISFMGNLRVHCYFSYRTRDSTIRKCGSAHCVLIHVMCCAALLVEPGVLKQTFCCLYLQSLDMRYLNNRGWSRHWPRLDFARTLPNMTPLTSLQDIPQLLSFSWSLRIRCCM